MLKFCISYWYLCLPIVNFGTFLINMTICFIPCIDLYKGSIKREAQDDMDNHEGPSKRPRSGGRAVDVRFLVQSKVSTNSKSLKYSVFLTHSSIFWN